jgi:hypothetical protein
MDLEEKIIDITEETEEEKNKREMEEKNKKEMEEKKEKYIELMKEREKKIKNDIIDLVIRQTTYTREEAEEKLETNKYNFNLVIKNYMKEGVSENENKDKKSINVQQQIYTEIRTMMDSASRKQRYQAELNERLNNYKNDISNNTL